MAKARSNTDGPYLEDRYFNQNLSFRAYANASLLSYWNAQLYDSLALTTNGSTPLSQTLGKCYLTP